MSSNLLINHDEAEGFGQMKSVYCESIFVSLNNKKFEEQQLVYG